MKNIITYSLLLILLATIGSCGSTDCPLNNTVMQMAQFYAPSKSLATIEDTLIITSRDSILLNRSTNTTKVTLPMSYNGETDTLVLSYRPQAPATAYADTIFVHKTNVPHYISLECGTGVFHTITAIEWSHRTPTAEQRYAIDSIAISNPNVTYDERENLQIYLNIHQ